MAASNLTNNPYVQPVNQTVVSQITSASTGALNNVTNNTQGAAGSAGSVASTIAASMTQSGVTSFVVGSIVASGLDKLVSGSDGFYTTGSPSRITNNALANRNLSTQALGNPDTKVPQTQTDTNGSGDLVYPSDITSIPYRMQLQFGKYQRAVSLGNTNIETSTNIYLPLPDGGGLVDNTSPRWGAQDLGVAGNVFDNLRSADVANALNANNTGSDIGVYAALQLGSNLGKIGAEGTQIAQSAAGIAPNPSLSMMFTGLNFRSFTLSWTFAPRSQQESDDLKTIINKIKELHLPQFAGGSDTLIFDYPYVVKPKILPEETEGYMTDFQWCVIKSVNVQYSPQDVGAAFYAGSHAPVMISLSIELEEMELRLPGNYGGQSQAAGGSSAFGSLNNNFFKPALTGIETVLNSSLGFSGTPGGNT